MKDFRTPVHPANADMKKPESNASPVRRQFHYSHHEDSENEFQEEEAVEIDCGVVDPTKSGEEAIQCKVCWSNE